MARKPDRPGGKRPSSRVPTIEELADTFGDSTDEDMNVGPADEAAAVVSMLPAPLLALLTESDELAPLLVGIQPSLTVGELDDAFGCLEDLFIALLAAVREQRRQARTGPGSDNRDARAATVYGETAIQALERFLDDGDSGLPGLDEATIRANIAQLRRHTR